MKKYFDTIANTNGDAVVGASITVYQYGTSTPASLFSDAGGTTPKNNPVSSDATGYFEFYAADGRYTLEVVAVGLNTKTVADVLLEDPADANPGVFTTLTVSGAASIPALTSAITADANAALAAKISAEAARDAALLAEAAAEAAQTGAEAAYTSLSPYLTDISVVASVTVDVSTVADIAADVTVVAGISADVTYVADNGPALLAAASDASGSAALAQAWATQLTTEVVAGQGYSAKQYALNAETHAAYFEPAILSIGNDVVSTQAEIAELLAAQYALAAQLAAVSVTPTNSVTFTNKAIDLGSNTLTGNSTQLATAISDRTGSGSLVFANGPTFTAPILGAATATSINSTTIPTSKTLVVTTDKLSALAATTSAELRGVISDETGTGALVFGTAPTITEAKLISGVTFSKASQVGIKLDETSPTFGWRDLTADINVRGTGANDPTFAVYGGYTGLYQYQFNASTMQQAWLVFHVPHDYVPGTAIHFHAHWSNAAATPNTGNVVWGFEYSFARGFGQEAFPATATVTVTQASPAVRYTHNVAETTAVTIPTLQVDGLILVRVFRDAANVADTCTDAVFLHTCDIHFQSTGFLTTKGKQPDFYA